MDLIHVAAGDLDTGSKGSVSFGTEGAGGLNVDFDNGIATLRHVPSTSPASSPSSLSSDDPCNRSTRDSSSPNCAYRTLTPDDESWSSSLRIDTLDLYDLGGHATPAFEEQLVLKPQSNIDRYSVNTERFRVDEFKTYVTVATWRRFINEGYFPSTRLALSLFPPHAFFVLSSNPGCAPFAADPILQFLLCLALSFRGVVTAGAKPRLLDLV